MCYSWGEYLSLSLHRCAQSLKAALDETIAALAKQPDLAGVLWERMLASVIVQPLREESRMASLARYDISYQLNEVEVGLSNTIGYFSGPIETSFQLSLKSHPALCH